jgi:ribose transport system permease protein
MTSSSQVELSSSSAHNDVGRADGGQIRARLRGGAERYALVILTMVVFLIFGLLPKTSGTFATTVNVWQVLVNQAPVTILAMGALIPLVAGSFALSLGANSGLAAVAIASSMSRFDQPLVVAMIVGLGVATLVGAVNGFLIAYLDLNPFIVTLGGNTLLTGLISWYTSEQNITTGVSNTLINFGTDEWLGVPRVLYLVVLVVVATWYLLGHHPFGRQVHAIGSSRRAAELVGINVRRRVSLSFILSGFIAGVCGVAMVAISGGAIISQGPSLLFPMLTVVFLSATVITPGRYNVLGTVIGVVFVAGSVSGLTLIGASNWVQDVFDGAALIVAVAVSTSLARRGRQRKPIMAALRRRISGPPAGIQADTTLGDSARSLS